jgi:uncharacterized phage protein (TIGR01671 family)
MREIKYRAWIPGEERMDFNDIFIRASGNPVIYEGKENPDIILMQFTGLKDKNGKEIWEGDIVTYKIISHKVVAAVEFDTSYGQWVKDGQRLSSYLKTTEVIGNIYENKNLLK